MSNQGRKPSGPMGWIVKIFQVLRDDPILIIPTLIALAVGMIVWNVWMFHLLGYM